MSAIRQSVGRVTSHQRDNPGASGAAVAFHGETVQRQPTKLAFSRAQFKSRSRRGKL